MKHHISIFVILLCESSAYNILSVLPVKARSHTIFATALLQALAQKGHNVTVFTAFPERKNLTNLHEHDIGHCFPHLGVTGSIEHLLDPTVYDTVHIIERDLVPSPELLVTCKPLQKLFESTQRFEVLITQPFGCDVFAALSYKLNVPLINTFAILPFPHFAERTGAITNPSFVPSAYLGTLNLKSFFTRLRNTYQYLVQMWYLNAIKRDDEMVRKWLGPAIPSLKDITKNTSLIFTNTHFSFSPAVPLPPGIIELGGIHIKNASKLPENIEKFINQSRHGVVYFSMGSLIKSSTFPEEKRNAFLYAFSKIQQRVLWKWDGDALQNAPDNVMIAKWMPQQDILAHPNVKLFISHGGLHSISEAVHEGVPTIGIPIFADQRNNIEALVTNGAGELLQYQAISKETVLEKIKRLIKDPRYTENMKQMSFRYKDRLMKPADAAVYWTEYVIRHKGARHLKPASTHMPLYKYLLLDVIAFVTFAFISVSLAVYFIVKAVLGLICRSIFHRSINSNSKGKLKSQ